MNLKKIKALLEEYYKGESTLEEEKILRNYFEGEDVDAEFIADKDIFLFNQSAKKDFAELPDLSDQIWDNILKHDIENPKKEIRNIRFTLLRVAAGAIVFIGIYFLVNNVNLKSKDSVKIVDTYDNPEDAYNETKKTLLYVSQLLNTGTDHLKPIKKIQKGTDKLNFISSFGDGLKKLEPLKKYNIADKYIKQ